MFGGGFLGVGPAEIFVIGAVGWLVLGPQRLFQVARDAGKVLGQLRKTADDAKGSFTEALEVDSLGLGSLAVPEELVRKPDQKAGEDELAHFREQLRRVSDPMQTADLDSPAMAAALAADPLPLLAGDIPPELDVPTDTALAELEAAYIAAKKKLLRKGLAELEALGDGDAGKKKA
ncbi:hypothetical protein I4F81_008805 [Pyropia yezoensis]|uniref:Uncharacterized protein n=1 Tax=Pyropia yezoensis TaxID=2788 RepID=A0ACC3C7K1_PYRYE|nr:hypothetical protein I4F81_008805 [Neopyropia yezoensis]